MKKQQEPKNNSLPCELVNKTRKQKNSATISRRRIIKVNKNHRKKEHKILLSTK